MQRELFKNIKESASSILPICLIVFVLNFTISPMPFGTLMLFVVGSILLIVGMGIFQMGSDIAVMPMGDIIGSKMVTTRKLGVFTIGSFVLGVSVTVAEPDLQVLAKQVPAVPDMAMVASVAFGVGVFLVLALLRILFQKSLSVLLIIMYGIVFSVASFTSPDYLAVAFDSGGVTTGPITVPFILALGMGVSSVRNERSAEEDSFGLCGICSIGPIIAVLIMGMFFDSKGVGYGFETVETVNNFKELFPLFGKGFITFFKEIVIALLPIVVIFGVLQIVNLKLPKGQIIKIGVGILYTLIGLTIFLTGINIGFMPAGSYLGNSIASLPYNWILIPIAIIIGFFVVMAEPAVHVLNKQVEDITSGAISKRMMMIGLAVGVSAALALSMIRIMFRISIWYFLLPGYGIALLLTFFVPKIFTGIAFDSGGVASGTMAAAFLLPFSRGVSGALGGSAMTDAFGIIAMVAMLPLVTIQVLGLIYKIKLSKSDETGDVLQIKDMEELEDFYDTEDTQNTDVIEF